MLTPIRGRGAIQGGVSVPRPTGRFVLPDADASGETAPANGVGGLSGLIGLQQVMSDPERDEAARGRGKALLAELQGLQLALLAGRVDSGRLSRLAALAEGESGTDPALRDILRALSLRARIELGRLPGDAGRFHPARGPC
ncbi:flagellar assembly protein FliX [Roseococcus pinisoli]|uniref:Flagellar assembly regulator FliX n=1 Tax=Roseococcus pinisoli TaxID=2835040 RepID=A0ABS5QEV5_9PROT|nr:flagellar assembly protein FliX [Roseococcus pinisoli]MBS7811098.1 hypothetical protein [Roseococcus pinisoli]